jgi:hypothetical protein
MDIFDKGALSLLQAARAKSFAAPFACAFFLASVLLSCGETKPPAPAAAHSAPARDVIVRTGRFAIHVNAYVAYYARAFSTEETASDPGADRLMDSAMVTKLGACSDDPCAKRAFVGSPYAVGLDGYLNDVWADDADDGRRTMSRIGASLLELEDLISPALASQIGRVWPNDSIDIFLARAPRVDPSGRDGALIDTQGECLGNDALLECLFTRALELLLPESDLGKGIEEARAKQDDAAKSKTVLAIPCVAALAVDAAVTAAIHRYQPTRRFAEACAPNLRVWLGDTWAKRMKKEIEAKDFGAQLVATMAK